MFEEPIPQTSDIGVAYTFIPCRDGSSVDCLTLDVDATQFKEPYGFDAERLERYITDCLIRIRQRSKPTIGQHPPIAVSGYWAHSGRIANEFVKYLVEENKNEPVEGFRLVVTGHCDRILGYLESRYYQFSVQLPSTGGIRICNVVSNTFSNQILWKVYNDSRFSMRFLLDLRAPMTEIQKVLTYHIKQVGDLEDLAEYVGVIQKQVVEVVNERISTMGLGIPEAKVRPFVFDAGAAEAKMISTMEDAVKKSVLSESTARYMVSMDFEFTVHMEDATVSVKPTLEVFVERTETPDLFGDDHAYKGRMTSRFVVPL